MVQYKNADAHCIGVEKPTRYQAPRQSRTPRETELGSKSIVLSDVGAARSSKSASIDRLAWPIFSSSKETKKSSSIFTDLGLEGKSPGGGKEFE